MVDKKKEVEIALQTIAKNFNINWLQSKGSHPLQILWNRVDMLSTSELFFFGTCLDKMEKIDAKWTKAHINTIKTSDINNRLGSFFEITCMGMLTPHFLVNPAAQNQSGYDGVVSLSTKKKIRLSIKYYGMSSHFNDFFFQAERIEKIYKHGIQKYAILASQLFIGSESKYPSGEDWKILAKEIEDLFSVYSHKNVTRKIDPWFIGLSPMSLGNDHVFSTAMNSYHIMLLSHFHKNEKKNLLDKLDEACYNICKYGGPENDEYANMVFIHLSPNASINDCGKWIFEYYRNFPDKMISGVFLYQPVVTRHHENNSPYINHFVVGIMNGEKFNDWNTDKIPIRFNIPVGEFSNSTTTKQIILMNDNKKEIIAVSDNYFYQKGNYYFKTEYEKNTFSTTVNVDGLASGVITHSVVQFQSSPAFLVLSPKSAPDDSLLIL